MALLSFHLAVDAACRFGAHLAEALSDDLFFDDVFVQHPEVQAFDFEADGGGGLWFHCFTCEWKFSRRCRPASSSFASGAMEYTVLAMFSWPRYCCTVRRSCVAR